MWQETKRLLLFKSSSSSIFERVLYFMYYSNEIFKIKLISKNRSLFNVGRHQFSYFLLPCLNRTFQRDSLTFRFLDISKIYSKFIKVYKNKDKNRVPQNLDFRIFDWPVNWPIVNFINILRANFLYKSLFGSYFYLFVTREKLPKRRSYEKFARKMLMKLTPCKRMNLEH